jgi:predicted nucleic acid-binding protein
VKPVFADAFYWIALTNSKDNDHMRALRASLAFAPKIIVTTDEVLTEFLAFCAADSLLRVEAAKAVQDVLSAPDVVVLAQTRHSFLSGLDLYSRRPDKGYSLTDCISMQAMRERNIEDVLTNDKHFEQEGFHALFRTSSVDRN